MSIPKEPEDGFRVPGGTNFLVRIQYHQNASWQGTIQWLDGRKTLPFRSMLEMIHLMEEALNLHTDHQWDEQFRHWKGKEGIG